MTPQAFLHAIIEPAARMLPTLDSPEARCLLLAIAGQESGWTTRLQEVGGPARGFWQCEKTGAVLGVLTGDPTRVTSMLRIMDALCIPRGLDTLYEAIAWNDALAYVVARLTLAADPAPLPQIGERDAAWECYLRNWRPGKPRPELWWTRYEAAVACFDRAASLIARPSDASAASSST